MYLFFEAVVQQLIHITLKEAEMQSIQPQGYPHLLLK